MINKSPAFQFYPDDWNNDINVIAMTPEEEGHYIRLCGLCWKEGALPSNREEVQSLLKKPCSTLDKILKCFYINPKNDSQLLHKRLEKERKKQKAWRIKSAKGGRKSRKPKELEIKKNDKGGVSTLTRVVEPNGNSMVSNSVSDSVSKSKHKPAPVEKSVEKNYTSWDMEFAHKIYDWATYEFGKNKQPDFEDWANTVRLAREIDDITKDDLFFVLRWACESDFWKSNVQTPMAFRKNYQMMSAQIIARDRNCFL